MTVSTCLNNAYNAGQISQDELKALEHMHQTLLIHYGNADEAKAEMVRRLVAEAQNGKRQQALAQAKLQKIQDFMLNFRNFRGEPDPAAALVALLEYHGTSSRMVEGSASVAGRSKALLGLAQARMEDALAQFKRAFVSGTTKNKAMLENVVREAYGEATGDAAAQAIAKAWLDTADWMRELFNAEGGAIGKLARWGMPASHDRALLMKAGVDKWIADITPRLDLAAMKNHLTGAPMTAADLRTSLEWIHKNITTDGWHEREASSQRVGLGKLSNQRAEGRFLIFKSADDWMAYARDYGAGDNAMGIMMNHLRGMADDVAAMQVLGPNPDAMLAYLQNFVTKQATLKAAQDPNAIWPDRARITGREMAKDGNWASTVNPEDYAREAVTLTREMWDLFRGSTGVVNHRSAATFGAIRNLNVASKLGSATLSAMSDIGNQQIARAFSGLPVMKAWGDYLAQFKAGNREEALTAGIILDTAAHTMMREARMFGGMDGPQWSQFLADRTITWSGLGAFTQAGRNAFGLAMMGELRLRADLAKAALPRALKRTLDRYGISDADWDAIRAVRVNDRFLKPTDVFDAMKAAGREAEQIGERFLEMITMESEYSTPQGTLRHQALAYGGIKRGTWKGESWRSMMQFKMFGLTVAGLQVERIAQEMAERGGLRGAGYAVTFLIATTLYGALSQQLKAIAAGKDPRPMHGEKALEFWGASLLQGGGLGIYGDFLSSSQARTGAGFAETIAGPTGSLVGSIGAMGPGNVGQFFRGEKTNAGREAVRLIGQNTPGGSLWYSRLAYEHLVLDTLQRWADPEADRAFARRMQQQRKTQGNEFWWRPGERTPGRAPNLGAALGR